MRTTPLSSWLPFVVQSRIILTNQGLAPRERRRYVPIASCSLDMPCESSAHNLHHVLKLKAQEHVTTPVDDSYFDPILHWMEDPHIAELQPAPLPFSLMLSTGEKLTENSLYTYPYHPRFEPNI